MMDRVELLLHMARNTAEEGREVTNEINERGATYLMQVRDLLAIAREAVEILERQEKTFAHFAPPQQQPAIKYVPRGTHPAAESDSGQLKAAAEKRAAAEREKS
jgi:hypothetical protein